LTAAPPPDDNDEEEDDLSSTGAFVFFHDDWGLLPAGCLAFLDGDGEGDVRFSLVQ